MHLSPEVVDTVADYLAIFVLLFVPALLIYVFWMVHILPEKIAERRGHPQADAIKTLCLLSLFFGGLLWPIAWLWAYSKPVFHKMAYGTDRVDHHVVEGTEAQKALEPAADNVAQREEQLATAGTLPREH
jgi:CBS domain containing-hemolysin-like protein